MYSSVFSFVVRKRSVCLLFRPMSVAEANGYTAIAGTNLPRDVEKGEDVRERSWYSLIGTALKHIWPRTFATQARVVICIAIVILQRLVNLAVPILCKPVSNPSPASPQLAFNINDLPPGSRVKTLHSRSTSSVRLAYLLGMHARG